MMTIQTVAAVTVLVIAGLHGLMLVVREATGRRDSLDMAGWHNLRHAHNWSRGLAVVGPFAAAFAAFTISLSATDAFPAASYLMSVAGFLSYLVPVLWLLDHPSRRAAMKIENIPRIPEWEAFFSPREREDSVPLCSWGKLPVKPRKSPPSYRGGYSSQEEQCIIAPSLAYGGPLVAPFVSVPPFVGFGSNANAS